MRTEASRFAAELPDPAETIARKDQIIDLNAVFARFRRQ
jgi:hypothetical protein